MLIKILKTQKGAECPRGVKTKLYKEGEVVDMFNELAEVFIAQEWGVEHKESKIEEPKIMKKAIKKAPEDKSIKEVENKAVKKIKSKGKK